MERLLCRHKVQELVRTKLGYLQFGFGHLPGKPLDEAHSWAAHPVPPVVHAELNGEHRRRRSQIEAALPGILMEAMDRAEASRIRLDDELLVVAHESGGRLSVWSGGLWSLLT